MMSFLSSSICLMKTKINCITDAEGSVMKYKYTVDLITEIEEFDKNAKLDFNIYTDNL